MEVTLDSVSLVTPDYLRGLIGIESEREMQQNQRAALAAISGEPIQIELTDREGNLHVVPVKVDARDFNFGVNAYALVKGENIPLFGKLMGLDSADAHNSELLEKMLGAACRRRLRRRGCRRPAVFWKPAKLPRA